MQASRQPLDERRNHRLQTAKRLIDVARMAEAPWMPRAKPTRRMKHGRRLGRPPPEARKRATSETRL